jgi:hypothetical protein
MPAFDPVICGLDFGGKGAVAFVRSGKVLAAYRMPIRVVDGGGKHPLELVDGETLAEIVGAWSPTAIYGEYVFSRRANGALSLGRATGIPLDRLRDPAITIISAKTWQKSMLRDWLPMVPRNGHDGRPLTISERNKLASIKLVQTLHPDVDLMPGRCTSPHDGVADSVCISLYGEMIYRQHILIGPPNPRPRVARRGPRGKQRKGA